MRIKQISQGTDCGTGAPVSGTHATDVSKEHKSDLTIEKGNPILHKEVYLKPPVPSKISRYTTNGSKKKKIIIFTPSS
jgi:hypothetical protein